MSYEDGLWKRVEAEQLYGFETMRELGQDQASFMARHNIEVGYSELPSDALEAEREALENHKWDLMDELHSTELSLGGLMNVLKGRYGAA